MSDRKKRQKRKQPPARRPAGKKEASKAGKKKAGSAPKKREKNLVSSRRQARRRLEKPTRGKSPAKRQSAKKPVKPSKAKVSSSKNLSPLKAKSKSPAKAIASSRPKTKTSVKEKTSTKAQSSSTKTKLAAKTVAKAKSAAKSKKQKTGAISSASKPKAIAPRKLSQQAPSGAKKTVKTGRASPSRLQNQAKPVVPKAGISTQPRSSIKDKKTLQKRAAKSKTEQTKGKSAVLQPKAMGKLQVLSSSDSVSSLEQSSTTHLFPDLAKRELSRILEKEREEKRILKDMEGRKYCVIENCDRPALVEDHCRLHFFAFFKLIREKKHILKKNLLEESLRLLIDAHSPVVFDYLFKDLRSDYDFSLALQKLLDEGADFSSDSAQDLEELDIPDPI